MPGSKLKDAVDFGAVLSAAALNGAANTLTATLDLQKRFTRVTVSTAYTHSAATSVTVTPTTSIDNGSSYDSLTTDQITAGSVAVTPGAPETVTGTTDFQIKRTYDVEGCDKLKLVYSAASAGAGDLITVKAVGTLVGQ